MVRSACGHRLTFLMSLKHTVVAMQAKGPWLGALTRPAPPVFESLAAAESDAAHRVCWLENAAALLEGQGATILAQWGDSLFFEAVEDVGIGGVVYFESSAEFENAMAGAVDPVLAVTGTEENSDAELLGYQIEPDDWHYLEEVFAGRAEGMPPEIFDFLKEAGLVAGSASAVEVTEFGDRWLRR